MKHILFSRLLSALLVVCASTLFFACQKDAVESPAPEALAYKDLNITDASGQNSALIRVSAASAALLEEQDWSKSVRLEAITETPAEAFTETGERTEAPASAAEVNFEILSQQLQPGVKGLALHFTPQTGNERWQWVYTVTTGYDNIRVRVNYGCHDVYYYRRPNSSSGFIFIAAYFNRCTPNSWTRAWSIPSHQMRAKVYYNSGTSFTVTTW